MESMEKINQKFWQDKRVFLTGHTGFKGAWLSLWLSQLGAKVTGYALEPPTDPSLFELCQVKELLSSSIIADIRDRETLHKAVKAALPEIVIHMAAQPLVRESYKSPVETYSINVMGTVNLFEAVKAVNGIKAVINVTSDKCYENPDRGKGRRVRGQGFKEIAALGGHDPYSSSKACSELVTAAYRASFFSPDEYKNHGVALASARAGNVIGGGDWAKDRLVPDFVRAILAEEQIVIRNPRAVRPWQHVLEPLSGYLELAQKLYEEGPKYAEAWNFGPEAKGAKTVEWIVNKLCEKWEGSSCRIDLRKHPPEAHYLRLDISKAKRRLNWRPKWGLDQALDKVVEWTRAYQQKENLRQVCFKQIEEYNLTR